MVIKAGIVGGTGYTGVELLRLLVQHPDVRLQAITSRKEAGTAVAAVFPGLRGHVGLAFTTPDANGLRGRAVGSFPPPNRGAHNQGPRGAPPGRADAGPSGQLRPP